VFCVVQCQNLATYVAPLSQTHIKRPNTPKKTHQFLVTPLSVNRGKKHEYLGINIDFSTPGKFNMSMIPYIKRNLDEAPEDMKGLATTPSADHLFKTHDTTELDEDTSKTFHNIVAHLLFRCQRAQADIHTAVSFMCTRV